MKAKLKRSELSELLQRMRSLTGIKSVKKALDFGRDIKKIKSLIEDFNEAIEKTKPPRLVELIAEMKIKFAKELKEKTEVTNPELIEKWEHGKEFIDLTSEFRKERDDFMNEKIEIVFKTVFTEQDVTSVPDAKTAEMLMYFMK